MRKINRSTKVTFVFSTHDQRVIDMADRRVDIEDGEIVRLGVRQNKQWSFAYERPVVEEDELENENAA
jgi:putative ABC transport system ATP-binding protein